MESVEVIGQEKIKAHLLKSKEDGRVHHAMLFGGEEGRGGLQLALWFAQQLLGATSEASQLKVSKWIHPDMHFSFPVNTNAKVKKDPVSGFFLEEWRKILLEQVYFSGQDWVNELGIGNKQASITVRESEEIVRFLSLKAMEANYKVVLVWQIDRMNASASNKLLKILEEPPEGTIFLMTANSTEGILPTILSRTQVLNIPPISSDALSAYLSKKHGLNADQTADLCMIGEGNYLKVLNFLNEGDLKLYANAFKDWMRLCFQKKLPDLLKWTDEMAGIGRESQKQFLQYSMNMVRECLAFNYKTAMHESQQEQSFLQKFAPYINHNNCLYFQKEFDTAIGHIERNANAKILFLDLSIQVIKLLKLGQKV